MIKDKNVAPDAAIASSKIAGIINLVSAMTSGPENYRSKIYYVHPNGSDSFDGLTPDEPFASWEQAITIMNARIDWTASPWAKGDIVVGFPGLYAENLTALPYGCWMLGLGQSFDINGEMGVTIKPASGSPIDCTSIINMRIENLCFQSPDTSPVFEVDNFNRNILTGCVFQGLPGASPTTTNGFEVVKDMTGSKILNSWFNQIRNGVYIVTDNGNSKQATGDLFEDLSILGGDQTGFYFEINCNPTSTIINRCNVAGAGATLALGLDDDTDIVTVFNTNFEATANDPASGAGKYNNCYLNGSLIT